MLLLLEKGVDIDAADDHGETALMKAALYGHAATVGILLVRGASLTQQDNLDRTALEHAAKTEIEELILAEQKKRELAEEMADFSPALKRPIRASRPIGLPRPKM
jgi:ankyrin repeat protein